jgi:hypothetical protein
MNAEKRGNLCSTLLRVVLQGADIPATIVNFHQNYSVNHNSFNGRGQASGGFGGHCLNPVSQMMLMIK